jgi:ABC-type branched-subunit amino acid transport system ATPase component
MKNQLLSVDNISKHFDGVHAVEHVSLILEPQRIFALIGPNGSGKTTLFNLLNGFLRPDEGTILYKGQGIARCSPWNVAKMGIGRLFQDVRVFPKMTVLDNMLVAAQGNSGESWWRPIFQNRQVRRQEGEIRKKALKWLEFVDLIEHSLMYAEDLSYGQQKLLAIARLLMSGADILLLDEPSAGVHPIMVESIFNLIRRMVDYEGKTVFFIEHDLETVSKIADWVYYMNQGHLVAQGELDVVLNAPSVKSFYSGMKLGVRHYV